MINIKPIIKGELNKKFTNINETNPLDWESFPVIQYIEEENKTYVKADDKEQESYIIYKIDIWNNESTSDIAVAVDEVFSILGFKRIKCIDTLDHQKLEHKVMRFEAIIDVNNNRIYNI